MKRIYTKTELTRLIRQHGSAYKAARSVGVSPQAFYDRMRLRGMVPKGYKRLPGEPTTLREKKKWLEALLKKYDYNISAVARKLRITPPAVTSRMNTYGIIIKRLTFEGRQKAFKKLFKAWDGYVIGIAGDMGLHVQSVYERMKRYGLTPKRKVANA